MHKVTSQRSSPFTITLPTEAWGHWKQIGDQSVTLHICIPTYFEIRNYRNLYFDQKAKENAQSLWGNSFGKDQVERIELKGDPYNKFNQFISMHTERLESS